MNNTDEIEIIFDETTKTYHAFWCPPRAIGAGSSELAALHDMQEAIHFCVDSTIAARCANSCGEEFARQQQHEPQEEMAKKVQEITGLLSQRNCRKCGFENCQQLALAVVQGKALPEQCRKVNKEQLKKICQIAGISPEPGTKTGVAESDALGRRHFRHGRAH